MSNTLYKYNRLVYAHAKKINEALRCLPCWGVSVDECIVL